MKYSFIFSLILLLNISSISAQDLPIDYFPPSIVPDRIVLTLTDNPSRSMAVTWRTSLQVKVAQVQLSLAHPSPDLADTVRVFEGTTTPLLSDKNGANYHSAVMSDLEPGTQYAYRVGDKKHWSEWSHFMTATAADKELSFIYFGDAQNDLKSMWSRAIRGAFRKMPNADFLLHAGDLVNIPNADHDWGEWFYAGGWIYTNIPSIATPGNHEYSRNDDMVAYLSNHWLPTFTLPENGPPGLKETVYYVDYEHVRIISLNSNTFYNSEELSQEQVKWLKKVLSNHRQKWVVITMHHPIFSSKMRRSNNELRKQLQPIFEEHQVDLVLQGHDHTYGRGTNIPVEPGIANLNGPMYVVSVSGPKMYDLNFDEWMQRVASNTQLYQLIHIKEDKLRYEAYMVNGELYDAFELQKTKDKTTKFSDLTPKNVVERTDLPKRYKDRYTNENWKEFYRRFSDYKKRKKKKNDLRTD